METGEPNLFLAGVWLIPLILLVFLAGAILLVRHWKTRTQADLKGLRTQLRKLDNQLKQFALVTQIHTPEDPEPYGSRAAALLEHQAYLEERYIALQDHYVGLQEEMRRLGSNQFNILVSAPYYWYLLRKDTGALWQAIAETESALEEASGFEQEIQRMGWRVALDAREARALQGEVKEALDDLRAKNILGDTMEAASQLEREIQAEMARIPAFFLQGEEEEVLTQASKEQIAQIHELLETTRPELESLLESARTWAAHYAQTSERVTHMQQEIEQAEDTFLGLPPAIQVAPIKENFTQLKVVAKNLQDTLQRLEIENMDMVGEEAERMASNAQETGALLKRSREQLSTLETVLAELSGGLKALTLQFASLGTRSELPIAWGGSSAELADITRQTNALGGAGRRRAPEQVGQDLARAVRLNARQRDLAQHCQQIEDQHTELLVLLDKQELSQISRWLGEGFSLLERTSGYAKENWGRADGLDDLPKALQALEQKAKQLTLADRNAAIPEGELAARLADTRALFEERQKLDEQLQGLQTRLKDLQDSEKQAIESLKNAQTVLGQVGHIVNSNSYLQEVAAPGLTDLQNELQSAFDELGERQRGAVGKKVKSASALAGKAEQNANQWLDQLNGDLKELVEQLGAGLTALDAIASLDEPAVIETRRLLASGQGFGLQGKSKSRLRLEELVTEFKRRNDYWQSCVAADHALQEVLQPALDSYEEANYFRQQAVDAHDQVAAWLRQSQDWPPTSITLEHEKTELERIEESWRSLKQRENRAIALVQQLGNLSARYQTLAEKIHQGAERADSEKAQVEEIEVELNETNQMWERLWYEYRDYPEASNEIRDLLSDSDRQFNQIKREYKRKSKNYAQILASLKALNRKVRYYQVALDEDHAIDSNGQVSTRR